MDTEFFTSEFSKNSRFDNDFYQNITQLDEWHALANKYSLYKKGIFLNDQNEEKIPKIIHQIWIGPKKFPSKYSKWASTWKKLNPTWIYKFWTESNLVELKFKNQRKIDSSKNIGYKTDLIRYEILEKFGGIYIDTDFECIRPIPDDFLKYNFVSCLVFSNQPQIANGMMMSKVNSKLINEIINNIKFDGKTEDPMKIINSSGASNLTRQYLLLDNKEKEKCLILPSNYFYPYPNFLINNSKNINIYNLITKETIGLHHWEMSWIKENLIKRIIRKIIFIFKKLF